MNKKVLSFVNKLEGYKTAIKELHWDADSLSQHELCDDIAETIAEFQDTISEVEQSITGKLSLGKLNPTEYKVTSLKKFVEDVLDEANSFYKSIEDEGDSYTGMRSDCESFLSDMQRKLYLVNFTMKEDLKRRIAMRINESRPKNLENVVDIDKFMGRRPKTMKARINQIYRIIHKYNIDGKLYRDDHWQAVDDYYRAISSLGCEVEMFPCANLNKPDWDIQGDGGYCDYAEDGMPRSKQYKVIITYEDGMKVEGYAKMMAAGSVQDPFDAYDTCMVLWPKSNRVLEGKTYDLTISEATQLIKEAVMNLINEYGEHVTNYIGRTGLASRRKTGNPIKDRELREKWLERKRKKENGSVSKVEEEGDSGIHIKKNKEGTFTAAANKHGKSVQGFASQVLKNKDNYSPAMVKKANFARNAKKWKK